MFFLYLCTAKCMNMQETKVISAYRQELKDKILMTAIKSFAQKGIRAVRMDDVAATLGISKRTLYEIYDKKELLLFECIKRYSAIREENLMNETIDCKNVMEVMVAIYKYKVEEFQNTNPQFYVDLAKYPEVLNYLNEQHQKTRERSQTFIERGIQEGYFRKELNYELTGRMFDAVGQYVMENQLYRQYTIQEIFNNLVFVSLRGICTEKGVEALEKVFF